MVDWVKGVDEHVLQWFLGVRTKLLTNVFLAVTDLGSTTVLVLLVLFALGLLLLEGRPRRAALAVLVIAGAYFAADGLKVWFARGRPAIGNAIPTPGSYSFPSSHALRSMAVYPILALCLWNAGAGRRRWYVLAWAVGLSLLIGVSRLYLAVHYLSDVVAGWLVGLAFVGLFGAMDRLVGRGERQGPPAGGMGTGNQ